MDNVELADGRSVPAAAVAALDELERRWPGATLPQARPAIVAAVLVAIGRSTPVEMAERLYDAFWAAAEATCNDETIHGMDVPYFDQKMDMVDCSGCGMPPQFWEHMAQWWEKNGKW